MENQIRQCLMNVIKASGPIGGAARINSAARQIAAKLSYIKPKLSVELHSSSAIVNKKLVINHSEVVVVRMLAETLGFDYEEFNAIE